MTTLLQDLINPISVGDSGKGLVSQNISWGTQEYIDAHNEVRHSGKFNFEDKRISIPSNIRHDRLKESLGPDLTQKELNTLQYLEFGFPINCDPSFGVRKPQKNHHSALAFSKQVDLYFQKGIDAKELIGPFNNIPIPELCFSPIMTVPKDHHDRRLVVDFSFPPGQAINEGIPKDRYLNIFILFYFIY